MYNHRDGHLLLVIDNIRQEIKIDRRWNCLNIEIINRKTREIVERFPRYNIEYKEY
jgi:hypothetical protein